MPQGKTTTKKCEICLKEVSLFAFNRHVKAHGKPKKITGMNNTPGQCVYCEKECQTQSSLHNHMRRCSNNPDRIMEQLTEDGRQKIIDKNKKRVWTDDQRKNHSTSMKKAVVENPESYTSLNVCGRTKVEDYKGEKFHGKWEVEFAQWLDANNIRWIRKVSPIQYFWNNDWHSYFPDFYLPEFDYFIEVKGFETKRDRCKWEAVEKLQVIKKKEIEQIRKGTFILGL